MPNYVYRPPALAAIAAQAGQKASAVTMTTDADGVVTITTTATLTSSQKSALDNYMALYGWRP